MKPFTKEMLLEDFGNGMELLSEVIGPFIGHDVAEELLRPRGARLPLSGAKLTQAMNAEAILGDAYDFAFEGRVRRGDFLQEASEIDGMAKVFEGLGLAVSFERRAFHLCSRTIRMAHHRLCLMGTMNFTSSGALANHILLTELAELANLDDKTLRNMTSAKNPHPLKTVKFDGRTFVSLNVATRFLAARGFKPTVVEDSSPERNFDQFPFWSAEDLAEFVRNNRERLGMSQATLATRAGKQFAVADIEAIEKANAILGEPILKGLANALGVKDRKRFISSGLDLSVRFFDSQPDLRIERARP